MNESLIHIYGLFWYLSNNFTPNLECIILINSKEELRNKLKDIIEKVDFNEVILDVENFLEDNNLLDFIKTNGKSYILEKVEMI